MKTLAGKVAFITGGSSGIGLGIARACAEAEMKVVLTYRSEAHRDEALACLMSVTSEGVHTICVDVTDRVSLEKSAAEVVEMFGGVHVLVCNAGVQLAAELGATSYDEWDRLVGVNVSGVFNTIHAFLPRLRAHGEEAHIVTTASVMGLFAASVGCAAYTASKFAIAGLTEALRAELRDTRIGVSLFCPGVVQSNLEDGLRHHPAASDPIEVGRLVVRGVQQNKLFILTHPEFLPLIQLRHNAVQFSTPQDLHPTESRLALVEALRETSIYSRD